LSGSGHIELDILGDLSFGTAANSTFSGSISGSQGQIVKLGTGTATFTGNSSFGSTLGGPSTVVSGGLIVDGSISNAPWSVNSGAILGGTGVVANVTMNGNLLPGASPGILTSSNLTFSGSGQYFVELNGPIAGSQYDQMNVRGAVNLGGSTLHVTPSFSSPVSVGDQFIIVSNDGVDAVVGIFSGLANGSTISAGGYSFTINYAGGIAGNDVVLTLTAVPGIGVSSSVSTGNGNHGIDPNECNFLDLVISNNTGIVMSGITATLSTVTPKVAITQPYSDYPNAPAFGSRTNTTPFQISTTPLFNCGDDINLELIINSATHGSFVVPFVVHSGEPAASPSRYDIGVLTPIPDTGTVESTNTVIGFVGPLSKVAVSMWLTHTLDQDLNISLISPDGITVDLSSGNGVGANFGTNCAPDAGRTTFDDSAPTSITAGAPPYVGTFRPEGSLATLASTTANGNWRLQITDNFGGSLGTLRCWSLFLYGTACAPGGGACDFCLTPISGQITSGDPTQTNRWNRNSIVASCASPKVWAGFGDVGTNYHYDVYTFTNTLPEDACVTVMLQSSSDVMAAAYLNSYDPSNIETNYLGDGGNSTAGISSDTIIFSTSVPAGAHLLVVVNEVTQNSGTQPYTLSISGLPCPSPALAINSLSTTSNRIHWPTSAGGYKLEANVDLGTTNWIGVTNEPMVFNGRLNVTNSANVPTNLFYRLHRP
jgi:subtilisin-like proprotein convertase family protein